MKSHHTTKQESLQHLLHAISLLKSTEEAAAFFTDLCTPAELEAMADRWQVVPLLRKGMPYRTIHDETGVSVTTITRVARCLSLGSGGYNLIYERQENT
ncbi:YerC/YecD family TrpR-related protein [Legionella oakridgensis]|uniref:TrpR-related protein YerC/YecD n=2 Tax=Legionella oakridgensis TaxID=29423 RepID=W0B9U5_9GAMM|nr:Trp operon repressor [Legionella oakridgensis]AHE66635.1 TrpR-related protein YerC/YecD [Legionella oakridgensis ATCC 33761 = DSM 21215]ETO93650.1 Trp operon repressor family [Legionella oakridgensis RV-2-2007]KTD37772.1 putative Trp repressor [Legionella oakridgensis]STY19776.1 putative Trp repressor [Legionella longbeachae]